MNISRFTLMAALFGGRLLFSQVTAVVDNTSYNAGSEVRLRVAGTASAATAIIRYAGEDKAVVGGVRVETGGGYGALWSIPADARTGRYVVDISTGGSVLRGATSFAVYRQLAKTVSIDFGRTFFTSGDSLDPRIVVKNLSGRRLENLRVEFGPYYYPWIAQAADEPKVWTSVIAESLTLEPHAEKEFRAAKAAVVQAGDEPATAWYSVVIRDSRERDRIYDLAFSSAVFIRPPNTYAPKRYPFLYLYPRVSEVSKSEAYRDFYPPEFVSDKIRFETSHTVFRTGEPAAVSFTVSGSPGAKGIVGRLLDADGKELERSPITGGAVEGSHRATVRPRPAGRYIYEVALTGPDEAVLATDRIEIAFNDLPKSILVFAAHEDDDTSHPARIRAAIENGIPIHFVFFTSGDAGGCERFYGQSCDAARAMDFGETREEETRASLAHEGVPKENVFFLGLPDGGSEQIWKNHVKANDPYLSVLLASDHSPYRDAAIPNLPYARDPVVAAAKQFIQRFHPDMIITGHPDERHVDHRTNNWFVVEAMQELLHDGKIPATTQLLVDVSYGPGPQKRAPFRYEKNTFFVPGEVARLGQEALWYYETQDGNHQQAEIVPFAKLPREEIHYRILDWQEHQGWNYQF